MPVETVTLFFALLAMALTGGLVVLGIALVSGRFPAVTSTVAGSALELATLVAVVSTLGSLYLSEGAGFTPCRLCWVQRGFMYPAALLLIGGLITRHRLLSLVAGAMAAAGLAVAVFHRWEQASGTGTLCDPSNPCSARWVEHFGVVTIPTMAAVGFAGVVVFVALDLTRRTS